MNYKLNLAKNISANLTEESRQYLDDSEQLYGLLQRGALAPFSPIAEIPQDQRDASTGIKMAAE